MDFNWENMNILVVEDEPANYLFIEKILKQTQVNLLHVQDGSMAIETVKQDQSIDLVLMDIYMPGIDGYEAASEIKKIRPELPVIAQTYSSNEQEDEKLKNAEFDAFIRKPININKLLVVVDQYLGHEEAM